VSHILDQYFLLAAKSAANARLDHPDALDRQPQDRRQDAAGMEWHLGAGTHHQAVVLIPIRDHHMRLNVRLLHFGHRIFLLINPVSFSESFFDIANVNPISAAIFLAGLESAKLTNSLALHLTALSPWIGVNQIAGSSSYSTFNGFSACSAMASVSQPRRQPSSRSVLFGQRKGIQRQDRVGLPGS
jgi:hypothetical protein